MWEYMSSFSIGCARCMSKGEGGRERGAEGGEEERESLRRPEG